MEYKVTLRFHGYLKDLCGGEFTVYAKSADDALKAFNAQTKVFNPKPNSKDRHALRLIGYDSEADLVGVPKGEIIDVVPEFCGGKGWFGKILTAVAVVVVTYYTFGSASLLGAKFASSAVAGTFASIGYGIAASLALQGITQLLAPAPDVNSNSNQAENDIFNSDQNTVQHGTPIPIGYGRAPIYGHILSFNIDKKGLVYGVFS